MINVIKEILYRIVNNTYRYSSCNIYFSSSLMIKANIGVVGLNDINFNSNEINIIRLENRVPLSDLVKNNKFRCLNYFKITYLRVEMHS